MPNYHSAELERHLLGLLIMYPAKLKELPINADLFYKETNQRVFSAIEKIIGDKDDKDASAILDVVVLTEEVRRLDKNITVSGISSLTDGVPKTSVKNLPDIVERLSVLAQKRETWKTLKRLEKALDSGDDDETKKHLERLGTTQIGRQRADALADEVREWVRVVSGEFLIGEVYRDLGIVNKNDRKNTSVILGRMVKNGHIMKAGKKHGAFRRADTNVEAIDWQGAPMEPLPLVLPLDTQELVNIYGKNIIVVAGAQNAGKTAYCLNFALANQDQYEIHYFTSEMGATETKIRLDLMDLPAHPPENIKVRFWERTDDFEDVIRPDAINIVDFLELNDEFYKVGGKISRIHDRLKGGIAMIGLQKDVGRDTGRGGSMGLEKPRLYLAINPGQIKIVKAKNWKGLDNPNGLVRDFKLVNGWNFIPQGPWRRGEPSASSAARGDGKAKKMYVPKGRFQF